MRNYKFYLFLLLFGVVFSSCEKKDDSVIDPILNFPSISNQSLNPSVFNSDSVKSTAMVQVSSVDPISKVTVTVNDPNRQQRVFELKDDGIAPDITANDGKYSGYIDFIMSCRLVGNYKVDFLAVTAKGLTSNIISQNFSVINSSGLKPVISNLIISPNNAILNQITPFLFKVNASDPDGPCDIMEVFYLGFRPDGVALSNSYELLDDGSCCPVPPFNSVSGDSVANDGIYTRLLAGAPDQQGYYKYFLRAIDRSNDTSNVLVDSIFVHP